MLTGSLPFQADSKLLLYKYILNCEYPKPKFLTDRAVRLLAKIFVRSGKLRAGFSALRKDEWFMFYPLENHHFLKDFDPKTEHRVAKSGRNGRAGAKSSPKNSKNHDFEEKFGKFDKELLEATAVKMGVDLEDLGRMVAEKRRNPYTTCYWLLVRRKKRRGGEAVVLTRDEEFMISEMKKARKKAQENNREEIEALETSLHASERLEEAKNTENQKTENFKKGTFESNESGELQEKSIKGKRDYVVLVENQSKDYKEVLKSGQKVGDVNKILVTFQRGAGSSKARKRIKRVDRVSGGADGGRRAANGTANGAFGYEVARSSSVDLGLVERGGGSVEGVKDSLEALNGHKTLEVEVKRQKIENFEKSPKKAKIRVKRKKKSTRSPTSTSRSFQKRSDLAKTRKKFKNHESENFAKIPLDEILIPPPSPKEDEIVIRGYSLDNGTRISLKNPLQPKPQKTLFPGQTNPFNTTNSTLRSLYSSIEGYTIPDTPKIDPKLTKTNYSKNSKNRSKKAIPEVNTYTKRLQEYLNHRRDATDIKIIAESEYKEGLKNSRIMLRKWKNSSSRASPQLIRAKNHQKRLPASLYETRTLPENSKWVKLKNDQKAEIGIHQLRRNYQRTISVYRKELKHSSTDFRSIPSTKIFTKRNKKYWRKSRSRRRKPSKKPKNGVSGVHVHPKAPKIAKKRFEVPQLYTSISMNNRVFQAPIQLSYDQELKRMTRGLNYKALIEQHRQKMERSREFDSSFNSNREAQKTAKKAFKRYNGGTRTSAERETMLRNLKRAKEKIRLVKVGEAGLGFSGPRRVRSEAGRKVVGGREGLNGGISVEEDLGVFEGEGEDEGIRLMYRGFQSKVRELRVLRKASGG